jgi:hypothetical protein
LNSVRVFLATTEGPSEVQRIAEEDPEVRSAVCLNGTSNALPISAAYDSFVRKPTGVIEKHFGHPVFRVDVSHPIADGRSWQLGLFAAHALSAAGRLTAKTEKADHVILVSGEVNHDLKAGPVAHVPEKLRQSATLFAALREAGTPLTVFLPSENTAELETAWLDARGFGGEGFRVVAVDSAADICRHLGLANPLAPADAPATAVAKTGGRSLPIVPLTAAVVVLAVLASAATLWRSGLGEWIDLADTGSYRQLDGALEATANGDCVSCKVAARVFATYAGFIRPAAGGLRLDAVERRAPGSKSCSVLRFGRAKPVEVEIAALAPSAAKGLCAVVYRLVNATDAPVHVWLSARSDGQEALSFRDTKIIDSATVAPGKAITAEVPVPRWVRRPLTNRVIAIVAPGASEEVSAWLSPADGGPAPDWDDLLVRLERAGLTAISSVHQITP